MRVLLAPRWVVAHVLVALIVFGCVNAGLWQLRRLEERRTTNALVAERMGADPVALGAVLAELPPGVDPPASADGDTHPSLAALEYRRVTVDGRYLPDEQLLLSPRTRAGSPGHDVLSPLQMDDGTVVVVDRGFVPFEEDEPPAAPSGEVRIEGLVRLSEQRVGIGPRIPPVETAPELDSVARVDLPRLSAQLPEPLAPVFVELSSPAPAAGLPRPVEPPALDEGNHLSYAVQWFLFALTGAAGYPLLLRKTVREARAGTGGGVDTRPRQPVG